MTLLSRKFLVGQRYLEDIAAYDTEVERAYESILKSQDSRITLSLVESAITESNLIETFQNPIVIVPGAFYKEYPQHNADGFRLINEARKNGIEAYQIPVPSFCSVDDGAKIISHWFKQWHGPPVILVSLSKGATDTVQFFCRNIDNSFLSKISTWITLSGLIFGTHLVEVLESLPFRRILVRAAFRLKGYRYSELKQLSPKSLPSCQAALSPLPFPSYHIVGFPRFQDLSSNLAKRAVSRLAHLGPSDGGGVLLNDYKSAPGTTIPLKGFDHYLKGISEHTILRIIGSILKQH